MTHMDVGLDLVRHADGAHELLQWEVFWRGVAARLLAVLAGTGEKLKLVQQVGLVVRQAARQRRLAVKAKDGLAHRLWSKHQHESAWRVANAASRVHSCAPFLGRACS